MWTKFDCGKGRWKLRRFWTPVAKGVILFLESHKFSKVPYGFSIVFPFLIGNIPDSLASFPIFSEEGSPEMVPMKERLKLVPGAQNESWGLGQRKPLVQQGTSTSSW